MSNNQTIDGVPRELLERLLADACNENWSDLNELLNSASACRCKRYGKGNPHWPCPVHPVAAPVVERQPDAIIEGVMTSVGITHAIYASTVSLKDKEQVRLYISPPNPVSVVDLIEAVEDLLVGTGSSPGANKRYGKIRACLDKVKDVNPQR